MSIAQIIREWLSTVALQLPEEARFATVQFSGRSQIEWMLTRYSTPQEFSGIVCAKEILTRYSVADAFLALKYIRGTTRAGLGLQTLVNSVFREGNRINYPDIVIVITDGRSADDPALPAEKLRSQVRPLMITYRTRIQYESKRYYRARQHLRLASPHW